MIFLADGRVKACCNSSYILGDIGLDGFRDIWFGPRATEFRGLAGAFHEHARELPKSNCFRCSHFQGDRYFIEHYGTALNALRGTALTLRDEMRDTS